MLRRVLEALSRYFEMEEINGGKRCPTYLYRWVLLRSSRFSVYLHHFVGDDWSRDHHDHPKRFISIGLRGSYIEERPGGIEYRYRAPWLRTFPAEHVHRLRLDGEDCWTLVIVGRPVREWGFWVHGVWFPWNYYVRSRFADHGKSCP